MSAFLRAVNVLPADRETGYRPRSPLDEDCRDSQRDVDCLVLLGASGNRLDFLEIGRKTVHLPVSGNELS